MKPFASAIGIALVAIYATGSGLWVNTGDNWYRTLNAPSWQPPDFVFGIIWPYNFLVLGISAVTIAQHLSSTWTYSYLSILAISVALALTWAYQFYRPHNLTMATIALALCAACTLPLLIITARASTAIAIALVPYQLWLITASFLSYGYMRRN